MEEDGILLASGPGRAVARIAGVETFSTEDAALVRVRTEGGHDGWGQVAPYHADITAPAAHYLAGDLLLDELINRRIGLHELNDAFDALRAGRGARRVLVID
jgi:Zn-dependent alcohol dehydrogenase